MLKARYCRACDGAPGATHDYEAVANLFVEDAVWDASPIFPIQKGRDAIRSHIKVFTAMPFAMHNAVNPVIEVNGDSATGTFNIIVMVTSAEQQAYWVFAMYDDTFVRTPEGWRFKKLRATVTAYAPYETGWAKAAVPSTNRVDQLTSVQA